MKQILPQVLLLFVAVTTYGCKRDNGLVTNKGI